MKEMSRGNVALDQRRFDSPPLGPIGSRRRRYAVDDQAIAFPRALLALAALEQAN